MGKKNTVRNKEFEENKWKEGQTGNPNGRPKGQRNYATIYREALLKIAELNKITPEDLENDMIAMAVKKARGGHPFFYKDVMDRIHGSATQKHDHTSGGKPIPIIQLNVQPDNSDKQDNST
jgi:hypothetical protein